MVASVGDDGLGQSRNGLGLVKSHSYTILSAFEVFYTNGTQAALLYQLRNPWGNDDLFNGSWIII